MALAKSSLVTAIGIERTRVRISESIMERARCAPPLAAENPKVLTCLRLLKPICDLHGPSGLIDASYQRWSTFFGNAARNTQPGLNSVVRTLHYARLRHKDRRQLTLTIQHARMISASARGTTIFLIRRA
jgi:hypothetical protein